MKIFTEYIFKKYYYPKKYYLKLILILIQLVFNKYSIKKKDQTSIVMANHFIFVTQKLIFSVYSGFIESYIKINKMIFII